jgi:hypothetical protein
MSGVGKLWGKTTFSHIFPTELLFLSFRRVSLQSGRASLHPTEKPANAVSDACGPF